MTITNSINKFLAERKEDDRLTQWDFCYNYFKGFQEQNRVKDIAAPENLLTSCRQLALYLGLMGMFRGRAAAIRKNVRAYIPLMKAISETHPGYWQIDADNYLQGNNMDLIHNLKRRIEDASRNIGHPTETRTTKIMLGVFGNVPAWDQYFTAWLGIRKLNGDALATLAEYYKDNKPELDKIQVYTLDELTGQPTQRRYTKARLIDAIGIVENGFLDND